MRHAVDIDLYRKELGVFMQTVQAQLRTVPKYGQAYDELRARQMDVLAAITGCRARANMLAVESSGSQNTRGAPAHAARHIRRLLDILDRYQDAGVALTDDDVGALDAAAAWLADVDGDAVEDEEGNGA